MGEVVHTGRKNFTGTARRPPTLPAGRCSPSRRLPSARQRFILSSGIAAGGAMTDQLPQNGLIAGIKLDCPTCVLAAPVLGALARDAGLTVYTQDDPSFPETVPGRIDDTDLDISYRLKIEVV